MVGGTEASAPPLAGAKLLDECRSMLARLGLYASKDGGIPTEASAATLSAGSGGAHQQGTSLAMMGKPPVVQGPQQCDRRLNDQAGSATHEQAAHMLLDLLKSAGSTTPATAGSISYGDAAAAAGAAAGPAAGVRVGVRGSAATSLGGASSWGTPSNSCRPSMAGVSMGQEQDNASASDAGMRAPSTQQALRPPRARPSGVPRLGLAQCGLGDVEDAGAHGGRRSSCGGVVPGGGFAESDEEAEAELAAYLAPPKWVPKSEGRWYVHKPVTSAEVASHEALLGSLPPAQAKQVQVLMRRLLQAQYSCELMASRGVRIAKDITSEWSRLTSGLLDRIEGYETSMAQLTAQLAEAQARSQQAQVTAARDSRRYGSSPVTIATGSKVAARRGTMGGAGSPMGCGAYSGGGGKRSNRTVEELSAKFNAASSENCEMREELEKLRGRCSMVFQEVHSLQVELQQTEEHAWRQHEALTQQSCILTGELEAEVQEHQRMLAEQAAESHRREEQLLREVASLRAALAAQQQQQRF